MKTLQVYLSTIKRCVCVCVCVCVYSVEKNSRTERKSVTEKLSQILQHLNLKNRKKYDRVNTIRRKSHLRWSWRNAKYLNLIMPLLIELCGKVEPVFTYRFFYSLTNGRLSLLKRKKTILKKFLLSRQTFYTENSMK